MKKIITLLTVFYCVTISAQKTPITDANFKDAINTCLGIDPINGNCTSSEYGAMKDWDVSQVTDMSDVKYEKYFNGDISNWDVSKVTNMSYMFQFASDFNQDIGSWDVSNVTHMERMFYSAISFDQDISNWCVTNITSEPTYFAIGAAALSENNKPVWGTCPNTSLSVNDQDVSNISINPNPVVDKLFITGLSDASKVSIYNVLGKLVISKTTSNEIDVDNLQSGIYIVKIVDEQKEIVKKFIKK
jgi:surface protein